MSRPRIARLIFDSIHNNADLWYASHFAAPDPFVYVEIRGRSFLLLNDLEVDRARKEARVDSVLPLKNYQKNSSGGALAAVATFLREKGVQKVVVPWTFPGRYGEVLRQQGFEIQFKEGPFFPQRLVVDKDGLRHIQLALRHTVAAIQLAIDMIKVSKPNARGQLQYKGKSLRSETVRAAIERFLLQNGSLPVGTLVAGGTQGADPHGAGRGILRANEPIVIDIFHQNRYSRYHGDITRTVVKGEATPEVKAMYRAVREALKIAIGALGPGIKGQTIHKRIQNFFGKRGFRTGPKDGRPQGFIHATGHGIGLDLHEAPSIGRSKSTLQAGNVVCVEPGLYYRKWGGMRIEDTVLITPKGARNLTRLSKALEI